jgi:hypothetical protein
MSSDYDFEELDSAFLDQVTAIEASHSQAPPTTSNKAAFTPSTSTVKPPSSNKSIFRPSKVLQSIPKPTSVPAPQIPLTAPKALEVIDVDEIDDFDDGEDILAAVDAIEAAYAKNPTQWKPPSLTRQTTLDGSILPTPSQQAKKAGPSSQSLTRTKSMGTNPFGKKSAKTKTWDRTAFAKTGWKKPQKGKGKAKGASFGDDCDHDHEEEGEEEEVEFAQFPAPFMSCKYRFYTGML